MKNLLLKSALLFAALTCGQAMAAPNETAIRTTGSDRVINLRQGRSVTIEFTGRLTDTLWLRKGDRDFEFGSLDEYKNLAAPCDLVHLGRGVYRIRVTFEFHQGPVPQSGDSLILRSADIRPGTRGAAIDWDRFVVR